MKKFLSALAFLSAFATIAVSCSKDDTDEPQPHIAVQSVKITPDPARVGMGETIQFKAEFTPENATPKSIEWGTRNESIASIDPQTGIATGVALGDVSVYVIVDGKTAVASLTVTEAPIHVESIGLNKTEALIFVGKFDVLTATITPNDATYPEVTWTSGDEAVATVDKNGKVVAVAVGKTTVTATADGKEATCEVTVLVPGIEVSAISNLDEGNTVNLTGKGFKPGDKVQLEALAGDSYSAEVNLDNATDASASFEFPADASNERSYKLSFLRNDILQAVAYLRPDNEFVELPYTLAYFMTGNNDPILPNDPDLGGIVRRGYMSGNILEFNEETSTVRVWKRDAALCPLQNVPADLSLSTGATGVTTLTPLKGLFAFDNVTKLTIADSYLTELDLTMFPNCTTVHGWGNPGQPGQAGIVKVNCGEKGEDAPCLLKDLRLERHTNLAELDITNCPGMEYLSLSNTKLTSESLKIGEDSKATIQNFLANDCQLSGEYDMTQWKSINTFEVNNNAITKIDFGQRDDVWCSPIFSLKAENNKLEELSIENCGQIRILLLAGNPIERLTLLNNSKAPGSQQWMYVFKGKEAFSLSWASAEETKGERVFNVEHYWWRCFSAGNDGEVSGNSWNYYGFENGEKPADLAAADEGWREHGPIAEACKDGVRVICWTYHNGGGQGDAHAMEGHDHTDGNVCPYDPSIY